MTREETISNLLYMKHDVKRDSVEDKTIDRAVKALEQEPKIGHWIKKGNTITCPICGAEGKDIKSDYCFNYCPVCGAKMESEGKK